MSCRVPWISSSHRNNFLPPILRKEGMHLDVWCVLAMVTVDLAMSPAFSLLPIPTPSPRDMECLVCVVRGTLPPAASLSLSSGSQQPMGQSICPHPSHLLFHIGSSKGASLKGNPVPPSAGWNQRHEYDFGVSTKFAPDESNLLQSLLY